jgi:hypothetical protein
MRHTPTHERFSAKLKIEDFRKKCLTIALTSAGSQPAEKIARLFRVWLKAVLCAGIFVIQ